MFIIKSNPKQVIINKLEKHENFSLTLFVAIFY